MKRKAKKGQTIASPFHGSQGIIWVEILQVNIFQRQNHRRLSR